MIPDVMSGTDCIKNTLDYTAWEALLGDAWIIIPFLLGMLFYTASKKYDAMACLGSGDTEQGSFSGDFDSDFSRMKNYDPFPGGRCSPTSPTAFGNAVQLQAFQAAGGRRL